MTISKLEKPMDIHVRTDGNCGTIVIKNPLLRNAMCRQTLSELRQAFEDLYQQKSVRAVVLTGDSTCFSAGTDLKELHSDLEDDEADHIWHADAQQHRELFVQMLQFPKPIIAAINGPAMGIALGVVAACDLAVASPNATFEFPEPRRGLVAGVAIPVIAYRLGASHAGNLLFRAVPIDAKQALQCGLVQEIVPFVQLWARARQWVSEIALASPIAVSMTKRILNEMVGEVLLAQLSSAAAACATARTTEHAAEGITAFLEKRPPDWS